MFSSKKRKSVPNKQQTISKFFKAASSEKKVVKKIPVISIIDDEKITVKVQVEETFNKDSINGFTIKRSIQKLKQYDVNSTVESSEPSVNRKYETTIQKNENKVPSFTKINSATKTNYTPLEKQFLEIKKGHTGVILFVECGYKYRFFGNDAEVASKELNIYCHLDHNFMTASIPVHRLDVHIGRLVAKGYKVGVVQQTETAAIKAAGDYKNTPFTRELTQLYTRATYINNQDSDGYNIVALTSKEIFTKFIVTVLAVNPSTGQIIYETLHCDDQLLPKLQNIFHVIKPAEIILPQSAMLESIEKYINQYKQTNTLLRIERINFSLKMNSEECEMFSQKFGSDHIFETYTLLHTYLMSYKLEKILLSFDRYELFTQLNKYMKLDRSTLINLELFENNINKQVNGSIFWVIDHTQTFFGKRLLRNWLHKPLLDVDLIRERLDAVSQLVENIKSPCIKNIANTFKFLPDLEKGLTNICHRKVTPEKFITILENMEKLRCLFITYQCEVNNLFTSNLICNVYKNVPLLLGEDMINFLSQLNKSEAKTGSKINLFQNVDDYTCLKQLHIDISNIELLLNTHKDRVIKKVLNNKVIEYKTISGLEYLIEVKNCNVHLIPSDWIKISSTKQWCRFRTPFVDKQFKLLCQKREELIIESNKAWTEFLNSFISIIHKIQDAVQCIAQLDCLLSLASVARQSGYTRPYFVSDTNLIEIKDGRHPAIEAFLGVNKQYVPNDVCLDENSKAMMIFGPNMGGKSSYIKQVAVLCILAQIGSYIPASVGKLSIINGVYTRMGAYDQLSKGKSTFMVELEEAACIMKNATSESLVILDELGRGTSTHDGTAIAYSTIKYFIEEIKPFLLFVTHYPLLSEIQTIYSNYINNYHMAYFVNSSSEEIMNKTNLISSKEKSGDNKIQESDDECAHLKTLEILPSGDVKQTICSADTDITFLYKLTCGEAHKSYGLNVASLAGIHASIIKKAAIKSDLLQHQYLIKSKNLNYVKILFNQQEPSGISKLINRISL